MGVLTRVQELQDMKSDKKYDSVIKNTCACKWIYVQFSAPIWCSQASITSVPGDPKPLSDLNRQQAMYMVLVVHLHRCKQSKHTHKRERIFKTHLKHMRFNIVFMGQR